MGAQGGRLSESNRNAGEEKVGGSSQQRRAKLHHLSRVLRCERRDGHERAGAGNNLVGVRAGSVCSVCAIMITLT